MSDSPSLCVLVLLAFFIYSLSIVRGMSFDRVVHGLEEGALTARGAAAGLMANGRSAELNSLTARMAQEAHERITLIDARGVVLADSEEDPSRMENHSLRPEVAAAMQGEIGVSSRLSSTVRRWTVYVAVPGHRERDGPRRCARFEPPGGAGGRVSAGDHEPPAVRGPAPGGLSPFCAGVHAVHPFPFARPRGGSHSVCIRGFRRPASPSQA